MLIEPRYQNSFSMRYYSILASECTATIMSGNIQDILHQVTVTLTSLSDVGHRFRVGWEVAQAYNVRKSWGLNQIYGVLKLMMRIKHNILLSFMVYHFTLLREARACLVHSFLKSHEVLPPVYKTGGWVRGDWELAKQWNSAPDTQGNTQPSSVHFT